MAGLTLESTVGGQTGSWTGNDLSQPSTIISNGSGSATITQAVFNEDPGFATADTFTDTGTYNATTASDPFSFVAFMPLTPALVDGAAYAVEASLAITATPVPGQDVILAAVPGLNNLMLNSVAGTDFLTNPNPSVCSAGVDLGGSGLLPASSSTSQNYPSPSGTYATATFVAQAGCDAYLVADFVFLGNGGGNVYSLTESFAISPIPEPLSAPLLATATLCVFAASRSRKSG
jgi:hypothetical protein